MTALLRRRGTAAWVAVGVVITGLSVVGVAAAQTPSPNPSASPSNSTRPAPPPPPLGMLPPLGRVLHGEATVQTPAGIKTVVTQNGTISAINGSTLTVRSTDGFSRDYTVDKATRIVLNGNNGALSSLEQGDAVHIVAEKDGTTYHAQMVLDGIDQRRPMGDWRTHRQPPPMPS